MSRKQYIITVSPDADPDTVASELKSQGLEVENVMREIGVISASAETADEEGVRRLKGVAAVEESQEYELPPPESRLQ